MDQLESVLAYIKDQNRVCPKPQKWQRLWEMLPDRHRQGNGWHPPLPLILAAWWETSDEQKRERLDLHVRYASEKGILDKIEVFLHKLPTEEWIYKEEV